MSVLSARLWMSEMEKQYSGPSEAMTVRLPEKLVKDVDVWLPRLGTSGKPMTRAQFIREALYDSLQRLEMAQAKLREIND